MRISVILLYRINIFVTTSCAYQKIPIIANGGWQHTIASHVKFSNIIKKFILLGKAIQAKCNFEPKDINFDVMKF